MSEIVAAGDGVAALAEDASVDQLVAVVEAAERVDVALIASEGEAVEMQARVEMLAVYAKRRRLDDLAGRIGALHLRLKRRIGQLVEDARPEHSGKTLPVGNVLRSVERKARSEAKTLAERVPDDRFEAGLDEIRAGARPATVERKLIAEARATDRVEKLQAREVAPPDGRYDVIVLSLIHI